MSQTICKYIAKAAHASPQTKALSKCLQSQRKRKRNFKKGLTARQKTMKNAATNIPTNHDRQGSTGGNSVYMAIAGEVVNRRSVLLRNFILNRQVSASNPLLHIHAKR